MAFLNKLKTKFKKTTAPAPQVEAKKDDIKVAAKLDIAKKKVTKTKTQKKKKDAIKTDITKKTKESQTREAKAPVSTKSNRYANILIKPHVTEKSTDLTGQNKYVFNVSQRANKSEIAAAIQAIYQIKPAKINIIKNKGKWKRYGQISGKRKETKKAIITLPQGKKLNIYEGV